MPIRLNGSTSGYTELSAPAGALNNTLTLPTGNGTSGQVLRTDGSGGLSFVTNGKLIQTVTTSTGAVATGTTTIPLDDTIPQNTEGDQYITLAITPTSAANLLCIQANLVLTTSANITLIGALFQDSGVNAIATTVKYGGSNCLNTLNITYWMTAGTTALTTFKVRAGGNTTGTTTFNGFGGNRMFGGTCNSNLSVMEVTP